MSSVCQKLTISLSVTHICSTNGCISLVGFRMASMETKTLTDGQIGKVLISSIAWLGGVYSCILWKKLENDTF